VLCDDPIAIEVHIAHISGLLNSFENSIPGKKFSPFLSGNIAIRQTWHGYLMYNMLWHYATRRFEKDAEKELSKKIHLISFTLNLQTEGFRIVFNLPFTKDEFN
jgi:hypothetical protein